MTTLAQLRTEAKELADEAGSTFVEDVQWDIWLLRGAAQLARVIARYNSHLLLTSSTFAITTPTTAANFAALPAGTLGIYMVERDATTTSRRFVRPVSPLMKNVGCNGLGYWRDSTNVYIEPAEQSAGTYKLWYFAIPSDIASGLPVALEMWWEYVAIYAAIRAVAKDKLDSSELRARLKELEDDDIASAASRADGALSAPIIDVEEAFTDSDLEYQ